MTYDEVNDVFIPDSAGITVMSEIAPEDPA
jgi:hypothetical protein